jgi:uncharacterized cofD-like protein
MTKKKVVVIGGGTGTFTVLSGLKKYPNLDLSVIVSMMDSGGSNRIIRDEFGLLPTSDLRQCIVALSSEKPSEIVRNLFTYRYSQGTGIAGMTFGNLFMAALTDIYGSQEEAIKKTCEFLDVQGHIIPVTLDNVQLVARYSNGRQVLGEHVIDEPVDDENKGLKIVELDTIPKARANINAKESIKNADMIILSPGDLFTSLLPNLVVEGIASAINKSKAKVLYVMNLVTKYNETNDFKASDFIKEIEHYTKQGRINICLIHNDGKIPKDIIARYKQENAFPVVDDLTEHKGLKVIRKNLIAKMIFEKDKADKLHRSLLRHDPDKLAETIIDLLKIS